LYAFCMHKSEMYPFYPFYPFLESITCVFATLARVRLPSHLPLILFIINDLQAHFNFVQ